jgi:putative Mg2+ transporter-C (MgtC) family protein
MEFFSGLTENLDFVILTRLLMAMILGAVVGFEREKSGKVAGLRTHALVSLGAALFTVISILSFLQFPSVNGVPGYDNRMVANIIVGIGFIGAGAIMKREDKVEGITTAASLWMVAAIGIASGFGFFKEAIASTVLVYIVLAVLWWVECRFTHGPNAHDKKEDDNDESEDKDDMDK